MKIMKNFLNCIGKLFYEKLKYKGLYVITSGDYSGSFFVYVEEENRGNCKALLLMPDPMKAVYVSDTDIKTDLKYDNIIFLSKLPAEIYEVVKANFIYYAKKEGIYVDR